MEEQSAEQKKKDLLAAVHEKLVEDGTLTDVHCVLQEKIVSAMSGIEEGPLLQRRRRGIGAEEPRDLRLKILDQLILEVLYWGELPHTAAMFTRECACDNTKPMREGLESMLGPFEDQDIPILLELIEKRKKRTL